MPNNVLKISLVAAAALILTACGPREPVTYRVPAETRPVRESPVVNTPAGQSPTSAAPGSPGQPAQPPFAGQAAGNQPPMQVLPGMAESAASFGTPTWKAPANWQEKPHGAIRRGSFDVTDGDGRLADMAVTVFPGDVGGTLANINRWRSQLGQADISAAQLGEVTRQTTVDGRPALVMLIEGRLRGGARNEIQSTLGAFVSGPAETWFFKMTGDHELILNEVEAFDEFLATVRFPGSQPSTIAPAQAPRPIY
jgi:hypothetical protein